MDFFFCSSKFKGNCYWFQLLLLFHIYLASILESGIYVYVKIN